MTFHQDFYNFLLSNSTNKVCLILIQNQELSSPNELSLNKIDFIKSEDDAHVSFTPIENIIKANEKGVDYGDPFTFRRFRIKVGRIITKIFTTNTIKRFNITDKDIEDFTNLHKAFYEKEKTHFIIVTGEDIKKYYDEQNYYATSAFGRTGTLWNSCMRHSDRLKFLELYIVNNTKLLVLVNSEDKVKGRALLWDNVINEGTDDLGTDIKIMDRIYYTDDHIVNVFKNWAFENGYMPKMDQSSRSERYIILPNRGVAQTKLLIKLDKSDLEFYPYLDTFKFFNVSKGILRNYEKVEHDYVLVQTNGGLEPPPLEDRVSEEINDSYEEEEAIGEEA